MGENWLHNVGERPGFRLWRIDHQSLQISVIHQHQYGLFISNNCYIALHTKIGPWGENIHSVFSWIGNTAQKKEDLEIKVQDLVSKLEGTITQEIEYEGKESSSFIDLFPIKKFRYINAVQLQKQINLRDEEYPTRLYIVKGKKNIRIKQMEVSVNSLNSGDVFILDHNDVIFQWFGKNASQMKRGKALNITTRMRDERMNRVKAEVILQNQGKETDQFWEILGGQGEIAPANSTYTDEQWDQLEFDEYKIYSLILSTDEKSLEVSVVETSGQILSTSMINPDLSYIIDDQFELFLWYGKGSLIPVIARTLAMNEAKRIISDSGRPEWTKVTTVEQGLEPILLKSRFMGFWSWSKRDSEQSLPSLEKLPVSPISPRKTKDKKDNYVNVDALHFPEKYAAAREDTMEKKIPSTNIEDAVGKELIIWIITDNEKHLLEKEEFGTFYAGESYIILYTVHLKSNNRINVLYYWQGRKSSIDDKGTAALLATDMHQNNRSGAYLVRVLQGKEPEHFLNHFEGHVCIRRGKRSAWNPKATVLYQIRGTNSINCRAVQAEKFTFSLNSNDSFVLITTNFNYIWYGKGSNEFERKFSLNMPFPEENQTIIINEESEPPEFWSELDGKQEYNNNLFFSFGGDIRAKFFFCSDRTGVFTVQEIPDWTQDDLLNTDTVILDGYNFVFAWMGKTASEKAKSRTIEIAKEYIQTAPGNRKQCSLYTVPSGTEPLDFTSFFHGWVEPLGVSSSSAIYSRPLVKIFEFVKTEEEEKKEKEQAEKNPQNAPTNLERKDSSQNGITNDTNESSIPASVVANRTELNPSSLIFAYDRLKIKPTPDGINPQNLEAYLSVEEFKNYLKREPNDFYLLPKWHQTRLKREVGLF